MLINNFYLFLTDNQGQRQRVFFLIRDASLQEAIDECKAFPFTSNIPKSDMIEQTVINEYEELLKR